MGHAVPAGIHDRRKEIDAVEMYVPFSWYEPMWLESLGFAEKGQGKTLIDEGALWIDGRLPGNTGGGLMAFLVLPLALPVTSLLRLLETCM